MPPEPIGEEDRRFLQAAARLAMRHAGLTAENPSVGCLIVRDGRIVGRGVTARGGRPHAERVALDEAGNLANGATAYVTLEPCAHHGRTPPCADALSHGRIARVVIGTTDPDPRVDGRGLEILRSAGIDVAVHPASCEFGAIEGFLARMRRGRPFLTLKLAVSADGFIGRRGEGQVAISGPTSNRQTHLLRARSDAVLIGIGTAVADDPRLTVRLDGLSDRKPTRIVVDPHARTPLDGALVLTARDVPLVIATTDVSGMAASRLATEGARVQPLETGDAALKTLMQNLATQGIATILCEGGARLAISLLSHDLVDRFILVQSPRKIEGDGVAAPDMRPYLGGFRQTRELRFGGDRWLEFDRKAE